MTETELLARIVEASEDAIVSASPDGLLTSWNDGAERLFGYTAAEVLGRSLLILAPDRDVTHMSEIVAKVMSGERLPPYETVRVGKDGRPIPVSVTVAPLRDDTGAVVGAGAILRDISEAMRARTELQRQRERLVRSQRVARVGSWEWDVASGLVTWSEEHYRLYGVDPRTFQPSYETFMQCVHPEDQAALSAEIAAAVEQRRGYAMDFRTRRADGSVRVIAARADVDLGEDRSVTRMHGTAQDVTEARALRDEIRREKETLELVGLATNDVIWDRDFRTGRTVRSHGMEAYGYATEEVDQDNDWWVARLHPEDWPAVEASLARALASTDTTWSAQYRFRRKDGTYAAVLDRGFIVRDAAGRPTRTVGSLLDVTERDRIQEAARRSAASAELLARASHELRTPLNAILGFTDLLEQRLDATLAPRERRYLQNIRGSGEHLLSLIDRLLLLAKADSGRLELQRTVLALPLLVKSIEAYVAPLAAAAGVRLTVTSPAEGSIRVDQEQMAKVLGELLKNAIIATPAGGSVTLTAAIPDDDLVVEVADTGRGIPEAAKDSVFGVFESIHDGNGDAAGTGLGLALCRQLVELHGGTITFESAPGQGTTFRVCIPHAAWRREMGERVLIVEDDPNDADLAMSICSEAGIRCEVVGTIAEALSSIGREVPLAAVVDLDLPDGSGRDVLASLRAADAGLPVLLVTADLDGLVGARRGERVTKPVDPAWLRAWLLAATATEVPA